MRRLFGLMLAVGAVAGCGGAGDESGGADGTDGTSTGGATQAEIPAGLLDLDRVTRNM